MSAKTHRSALSVAALLLSGSLAGCQGDTQPRTANANSPAASTPASTPAASPAVAATTPEPTKPIGTAPAAASNSLATPTDAYKTGYAARQNKDIEGLKRVMSKEALDFLTDIGKAEGKTLDEELKQMTDRPQASTPDTRNEKITGNRATLEYLNEKGNWVTMDFVKDGNNWKIGLPKAP
jgi:hypothetical protein